MDNDHLSRIISIRNLWLVSSRQDPQTLFRGCKHGCPLLARASDCRAWTCSTGFETPPNLRCAGCADEMPVAGAPASAPAAADAPDAGDAASLEDGAAPARAGAGLSRWHDDDAAEDEVTAPSTPAASVLASSGCVRVASA
jgi:hypothetical protein